MILRIEKDYAKALSESTRVLKKGGMIVFPTDTVYGLGGNATDPRVVEKIYELKNREAKKPLAVIMDGLEMMMEWCEIYEEDAKTLMEYLPGPYTFILKLKEGKTLAGQKEKIGVRVPNNFFVRKLVENFGKPVIATSANLSGRKDAVRLGDIEKNIIKKTDLALDGGETTLKKPSTVVDLVERKIVRKGSGEFEFK